MSRWHEECLGRCEDCILSATLCETHQRHSHEDSYKFINIGPVRYGMRLGAVSPPPPGAGSRYRSQTCWQTTPCGDSDCDNVAVSRIPPLTTKSINSFDIISNVNRIRTNDDKLPAQQTSSIVRDHVLHSGKCLLKTQVKRCALVRPQVYTRLSEYGDVNSSKENSTLDRLPRFRFGGNRSSANDKWTSDQRYKELTNRLKRSVAPVPVPPPRSRHSARSTPQTSPTPPPDVADCTERLAPLRCSSFSKADFTSDDKYGGKINHRDDNTPREISTLPRFKNINRQAKNFTESSQDKTKLRNDEPVSIFQFRAEDIPDISPTTSTNCQGNVNTSQDKKRDKSRRRKGIYISQWPNSYQPTKDVIPQFDEDEYIPRVVGTDQLLQNSLAEISRYQTPERDNNVFCSCSAPQEEPLSPEDNNLVPEWPILRNPVEYRPLSRSPEDTELSKDLPRIVTLQKSDSLSEGEPDLSDSKFDQTSFVTSDLSDCENKLTISTDLINPNISRRYSKRPLRGPYGQMLEAEMKKPEIKKNINSDLRFLEDLSNTTSSSMNSLPKPKTKSKGCNSSLDETTTKENKSTGNHWHFSKQVNQRKLSADNLVVPNGNDKKSIDHQRTSSSPSKLGRFTNIEVSSELLEELLRGSSEQLAAAEAQQIQNDTRTHVVVELYDNERSYVESLEILATKYLEPLKAPENTNLLEANLVDEIFYQIPLLLNQHQLFLEELRIRLENWDIKQKIGDVFLEMFSQPKVIESYTNYVNNWKRAREILKSAQQSKPAFSRFLEVTARQHTGKLALDSLLIKPIQKFPKYELLLQRLIKHTDENHPDHSLLLAAQRQVHDQLLKINCTEKEALELEQLREIEGLIDGLIELATPERLYVRHDSVSMSYGGRPRKERVLFLFSDLLLITSIKRKSGTIKKPITGQGHVTSSLEANKYKLLMRIPLEDIEIIRPKDDSLKQIMTEMDNLTEDIALLNQINELVWTLHCSHTQLEEDVRELLSSLNKQLNEQQNADSQLCCLDLTVSTPNGPMNVSIVFSKAEERSAWEESIIDAKQKLAMSGERKPCPEIMASVPIRKTRAGLQFTCAAPTSSENGNDVWVCNSDGYVGQLCVLSLTPEPTVTSCNGVCNARILCIASIPGINKGMTTPSKCVGRLEEIEDHKIKPMHFDSSSSSDEDDNCDCEHNEEPPTLSRSETASLHDEETDNLMPTMWLGTEDGCIHVYSAGDNIRIKKNKIKLQLGASILCIAYLENRVFVSLGNGELSIYERDTYGNWDTGSPSTITVGTLSTPVTKMVPSMGKLWCTCGSNIRIFNTHNLTTENHFSVCNDVNKSIACIILCGNGVWLSLQNSAIVKCYHSLTFELLCEINVAPAVTKMLTSCDDIIRQHKAACLRVTALVSCKDLLWIGTSAGVLLTMPLPHISSTTTKLTHVPTVTGIPHGHTGHVRFLTSVEIQLSVTDPPHRHPHKGKHEQRNCRKLLVISGGDGYEDFRTSNLSEVAGREDSTNHLLLWNI